MSVKAVSMSEVGIRCWSAVRHFQGCHKCNQFRRHWKKGTEESMDCPKDVNPEILELLTERRAHFKQIRELESKIKLIEGNLIA